METIEETLKTKNQDYALVTADIEKINYQLEILYENMLDIATDMTILVARKDYFVKTYQYNGNTNFEELEEFQELKTLYTNLRANSREYLNLRLEKADKLLLANGSSLGINDVDRKKVNKILRKEHKQTIRQVFQTVSLGLQKVRIDEVKELELTKLETFGQNVLVFLGLQEYSPSMLPKLELLYNNSKIELEKQMKRRVEKVNKVVELVLNTDAQNKALPEAVGKRAKVVKVKRPCFDFDDDGPHVELLKNYRKH